MCYSIGKHTHTDAHTFLFVSYSWMHIFVQRGIWKCCQAIHALELMSSLFDRGFSASVCVDSNGNGIIVYSTFVFIMPELLGFVLSIFLLVPCGQKSWRQQHYERGICFFMLHYIRASGSIIIWCFLFHDNWVSEGTARITQACPSCLGLRFSSRCSKCYRAIRRIFSISISIMRV